MVPRGVISEYMRRLEILNNNTGFHSSIAKSRILEIYSFFVFEESVGEKIEGDVRTGGRLHVLGNLSKGARLPRLFSVRPHQRSCDNLNLPLMPILPKHIV